ncbi:IclR family transcriptional regulator [Ancylobacter sonchi]|uniref:IclR family transcriptional regulator n=1 Tax=Ancylobacter sonchi TaxID=1937790 RepID=UPI001BD3CE5D|nr:IclR family transcriptional regulator [Ancylobacter sonchi]MBS7533933.1 IclR family transcriptional regulator [Ancylobacter sonchi]
MKETDFIGGFAKGLKVIEAFDAAKPRLSITDIAKLTGLDRATARRCLLTLAALGYADYDGKFFSLTPRILRLGHAYLSATPLPSLLQPHLDQLSEAVGQSASASVLDGEEIVYIARAAQKRVMSINLLPGSRLPAWCSSMGRVLLAALGDEEVRQRLARARLEPLTPFTRVDPQELLAEIGRVRAQGYAVIDQELEIGLCSIAVPVRDVTGRVVVAINIGAPAAVVAAADMPKLYLPELVAIQQQLAVTLR